MGLFICDVSSGQETLQISFCNEIDDEMISHDVEYTSVNVPGCDSSELNFSSVPLPCLCTNECQGDSCSCASQYGFPYRSKKLLPEYSCQKSKVVIECSCLCMCSVSCPNRVVQHGIQYKLQVFKTKHKGFGVRALVKIPQLAFVCEYAGEVIGLEEAEIRIKSKEDDKPNYVFILQEYSADGNITKTFVDATHTGNVGRYINHSCCPNLILVPVRIDNMVPKICLFASRDIAPLEELCYDYGNNRPKNHVKNSVPTATHSSMKSCFCESKLCLGYLPSDSVAFS